MQISKLYYRIIPKALPKMMPIFGFSSIILGNCFLFRCVCVWKKRSHPKTPRTETNTNADGHWTFEWTNQIGLGMPLKSDVINSIRGNRSITITQYETEKKNQKKNRPKLERTKNKRCLFLMKVIKKLRALWLTSCFLTMFNRIIVIFLQRTVFFLLRT